jgi:hypothetical protein
VRHHPKAQRELSRTLAKLRAAIAPRSDARVATERKGDASSMDLEAAWRKLTSRRRRKPVSEPPSEEKTRRALRSPVEFDFLDTPLCDGVRYLSDYHDIPIWLDEQGLTDDNIAPDTPVTLRLEGRSLESALELLLTPLQIDYGIDGGSLQITAMAVMNKTFSAEFYSVRELVEGGFTEDELREILTPSLKVRAVTHEGSNPFGGIGRLMDTVPMPDEQPTLRLVAGRILVVRATPRGHRQLLGALEKLRAGARR